MRAPSLLLLLQLLLYTFLPVTAKNRKARKSSGGRRAAAAAPSSSAAGTNDASLQAALFGLDPVAARAEAARGGKLPDDLHGTLLESFCYNGWVELVQFLLEP
eukprot:SAG31_NODE_18574_length_631_cov_0.896617_1_plen_103_part_00